MLSAKGSWIPKTARMLAYKQPPFKKCVIAYWSRSPAPIMNGTKHDTEAAGVKIHHKGTKTQREVDGGKPHGFSSFLLFLCELCVFVVNPSSVGERRISLRRGTDNEPWR